MELNIKKLNVDKLSILRKFIYHEIYQSKKNYKLCIQSSKVQTCLKLIISSDVKYKRKRNKGKIFKIQLFK